MEFVSFSMNLNLLVSSSFRRNIFEVILSMLYIGSVETARVLLEAGASIKAINKVNRTASQLGAFVG